MPYLAQLGAVAARVRDGRVAGNTGRLPGFTYGRGEKGPRRRAGLGREMLSSVQTASECLLDR